MLGLLQKQLICLSRGYVYPIPVDLVSKINADGHNLNPILRHHFPGETGYAISYDCYLIGH